MKNQKIKNNSDLSLIIREEIRKYGNQCDLNHLDVSSVKYMDCLFRNLDFNGDISRWDVSRVQNMVSMFEGSNFNGDISGWNVSRVKYMNHMFGRSMFNQDISKWDVSKLECLDYCFRSSKFSGDLSLWEPKNLSAMLNAFKDSKCEKPYWAMIENKEERNLAILKNKKRLEIINSITANTNTSNTSIETVRHNTQDVLKI